MNARRLVFAGAEGLMAAAAAVRYRRWRLGWGATDEEPTESYLGLAYWWRRARSGRWADT